MSKRKSIVERINAMVDGISAKCDPLISHAIQIRFTDNFYCSDIIGSIDDCAERILNVAKEADADSALSGYVLYNGSNSGLVRFLFDPDNGSYCCATYEPANTELIDEEIKGMSEDGDGSAKNTESVVKKNRANSKNVYEIVFK